MVIQIIFFEGFTQVNGNPFVDAGVLEVLTTLMNMSYVVEVIQIIFFVMLSV